MTNKEAVTDYSPEAVEAILGAFNDRVLQAIQDEDRVDDIVLHDHLREAIAKTMEDPDSPWSDVTVGRTSPTPLALMVYDEHGVPVFDTTGMPYSKAKAKASGKGPRAVVWPPYPQATNMDPVARTNLMVAQGSICQQTPEELYQEAHVRKIEKRRRAIIMRENMARRTLIRANPQYEPFRPTDIHECSSDSDLPGKSFRPISIPGTLVLEI